MPPCETGRGRSYHMLIGRRRIGMHTTATAIRPNTTGRTIGQAGPASLHRKQRPSHPHQARCVLTQAPTRFRPLRHSFARPWTSANYRRRLLSALVERFVAEAITRTSRHWRRLRSREPTTRVEKFRCRRCANRLGGRRAYHLLLTAPEDEMSWRPR
jgi:hypothetical protein